MRPSHAPLIYLVNIPIQRLLIWIALGIAILPGCVERKLFLRSTPSGAEVYLDGQPMGNTPVEIPFTHYGERNVILRYKKYETLETRIQVKPPIYEVFPLDFISECILPFPLEDHHTYHFELKKRPSPMVTPEEREQLWKKALEVQKTGKPPSGRGSL